VAPDHLVVVLLELEGGFHLLVAQGPVAVLVVEIAFAVLEEDADGLVLGLADDAGVAVAAADVGEAADVAEDLGGKVGALPGDGGGADVAGSGPADAAAGGIGA